MKERDCKAKGEQEPEQQLLNLTLPGGKKRIKSAKLLPSLSPLTVLAASGADELISALRLSLHRLQTFPSFKAQLMLITTTQLHLG